MHDKNNEIEYEKIELKPGTEVNGITCDKAFLTGNSKIGYAKVGIKYPDITPEENEKRITELNRVSYEIVYKIMKEGEER